MHNMPGLPVGDFAIRPGGIMAAADEFSIVVTGGAAMRRNRTTPSIRCWRQRIMLALQRSWRATSIR